MSRCLVTGGAGLIGSHLVKRLLDQGRDVVIADDFSRGNLQNLLDLGIHVSPVYIDLKDYCRVMEVMDGVESVFHLAAWVGNVQSHTSEMTELLGLQANLLIDANVFRACVERGVRALVYASSVSVYPTELQQSCNVLLREDDLRYANPEGGYGWAKLMAEKQLHLVRGINSGIARLFNIYGENAELGQNALVVLALIRKAILYPKEEFRVWGSGKQMRDLLYVSDAVEALLKLEERASFPPLVVNVGSGQPTVVELLVKKIVRLSGKGITPTYDPTMPVGVLSRVADISRAKALLDWSPRIELDEGLERTFSWVSMRLKALRT